MKFTQKSRAKFLTSFLNLFALAVADLVGGGGIQGGPKPPFIPNMYETTLYPEIKLYKLFRLCVIVTVL